MVPIVYGAPNSHQFEPAPNSILFVRDFPSIEALAKRIIYLANNEEEYVPLRSPVDYVHGCFCSLSPSLLVSEEVTTLPRLSFRHPKRLWPSAYFWL